MQKERLIEIDRLRGIAMLAIILIHANAYFLNNKLAYILWDINQYAVPIFIFCSFYLFFKKEIRGSWEFIKKRFLRLLVPYWVFLLFFIPLNFFKEPSKMQLKDIFQYVTLTTPSNDLSWLVLLFLMLTLVGLFINKVLLAPRSSLSRVGFLSYCFLSLASSILFIFYKPSFNQKLTMWLPWSLIIIFTWYFVKRGNNKNFLFYSTIISGLTFLSLRFLEIAIRHPLSHYDNKYPSNLYHLSYGIFGVCVLYYLAKSRLMEFYPLRNLLHFLSINSYSIYFLHFLILYYFILYQRSWVTNLNWYGFFTVLLISTFTLQIVLNKARDYYVSIHRTPTI